MAITAVVKNIRDRIAEAKKIRSQVIKKIAMLMLDQSVTVDGAIKYFDNDGSGSVTRDELNVGFKRMKVVLNEALIKNLFTILDENHDNEITLSEFKAVFAGVMGD